MVIRLRFVCLCLCVVVFVCSLGLTFGALGCQQRSLQDMLNIFGPRNPPDPPFCRVTSMYTLLFVMMRF